MKTFTVVILYAALVGALNLGGVVWDHFTATHVDRKAVAVAASDPRG